MLTQLWNALQDSVALLDEAGRIVSVNRAWRQFGQRNGLLDPDACLKSNYLEICDGAQGPDSALARSVAAGIRRVLAADVPAFEMEYPCHSPEHERWFLLRATPLIEGGRSCVVLVHEDITRRHQAEWERETTIEFLRLVNANTQLQDLIEASVRFFREKTGCEAVGIRLQEGDDYPYYLAQGFPERFVRAGNLLCSHGDNGLIERDAAGNAVLACMCGNVICGRFDSSKPFFTPAGTFWTNSTTELLANTTEPDGQARTRNRCHSEGYESVALFALRVGEERLGLLQINDRRKNRHTPESVALLERLAGYLAVALAHVRSQEELRKSQALLNAVIEGTSDAVYAKDLEGRITLYNSAAARAVGKTPADVRGKDATFLFPPDEALSLLEADRKIITEGIVSTAEENLTTPSGTRIFLTTKGPLRDENGRAIGLFGIARDITERKRGEEALRKSEERFRRYFELGLVGIAITSPEKGCLEVNDEFCRTLGHPRHELLKMTWADMTHPDDLAADVASFDQLTAGNIEGYSLDKRFIGKDGRVIEATISVSCLRKDDGSVDYLIGMLQDITERKRSQEALRKSEERYRRIFSLGLIGMAITSPTRGWLEVNDEICRILGYSREELTTISWETVTHPDDLAANLANFQRVITGEIDGYWMEKRCVRKGGRIIDTILSVKCLRNQDGSVDYFVVLLQDITERKNAEMALKASEEEFRSLAEAMPQIVWVSQPGVGNIYSNRQWLDYTGLTMKESQGEGGNLPFHPEDVPRAWATWQRATQTGEPFVVESRLRRFDGVYRRWLTRAVPVRNASGEIVKWFGTSTDIEDIKLAQDALRVSEERHRTILQTAMDGFLVLDLKGRLLEANDAYCRMSGYSEAELLALRIGDLSAVEASGRVAHLQKIVAHGEDRFESRHRRKDGSVFDVEASVKYRDIEGGRLVCFIRDISERKRTQAEAASHQAAVAHLARLNTMGQMVTGLAHELNQPLTAVRNYAHYGKAIVQSGKEVAVKLPEALDKIDQAAARAAQIIQRLREFVRKQPPMRTATDINRLIKNSLELMGPALQRGQIRMEMRPAPALPEIKIDPVQIEQVLVNLIQNAIDAMAEELPARRVLVLGTHAGEGDQWVHIEVADRGCGIPPENQAKIFEEFFTTKAEGSGLGLAISKNIVDTHGGRLEARSNPAGGMTFELVLPAQKGT